jgi:hypothetical protein
VRRTQKQSIRERDIIAEGIDGNGDEHRRGSRKRYEDANNSSLLYYSSNS